MSAFTDLLADAYAARRYLVVLEPYDPGAGDVVTLYHSDHGFVTEPGDSPANQYFEPRVVSATKTIASIMQIGQWESLDQLPREFDALLADGNIANYYSHPSWYRNFLATCLDPGDQVSILGLRDDEGEPLAVLPLRRPASRRGLFKARRFESLSNFYTCRYQPLVKPDADPAKIAALLASALRRHLSPFDVLQIDSLPRRPDWPAHLCRALGDAGFLCDRYFHFINRYEDVGGLDYDGYLAKRPGKLRSTLKRRERKLRANGDLSFRHYGDAVDLSRGVAAYEQVHLNSWKPAEPYPDFTAGLARQAASAGALRLGILHLDGRPIAAQIWLVHNGRATIFKLSHDEAYKSLSPGTVLTAWMVRRALQHDKLLEIDFGRGDDLYKRDWLSQRRECWGIVACNPNTLAGLAAATRLWLPARLRRLLGRRRQI